MLSILCNSDLELWLIVSVAGSLNGVEYSHASFAMICMMPLFITYSGLLRVGQFETNPVGGSANAVYRRRPNKALTRFEQSRVCDEKVNGIYTSRRALLCSHLHKAEFPRFGRFNDFQLLFGRLSALQGRPDLQSLKLKVSRTRDVDASFLRFWATQHRGCAESTC